MHFTKSSIFFFFTVIALPTFAQTYEEDFNYDSIIDELSTGRTRTSYSNDPFANVMLHAGVGLTMSIANLKKDNIDSRGLLQGVEINLGIDLFSRYWMAEGSYRNLGSAEVKFDDHVDTISISEFDLKLVNRSYLGKLLVFRVAGGLAARYISYIDNLEKTSLNYNTPAWLLSLGLDAKLSKTLTFGADLAFRSAIIDETVEESALGATFRIDTHF